MSGVWRNWVRIECRGKSARDVRDQVSKIMRRPDPSRQRTVVVLSNVASLEDSMSNFLRELVTELEPRSERTCLIDRSGYTKLMMDALGTGEKIRVYESEFELAEETTRRRRESELVGGAVGASSF